MKEEKVIMKKKILFIMDSLRIGGAEKSLITILNLFDYEKYEVDLYLLNHVGEFYNLIPEKVNVLNEDETYKIFINNRKKSIISYIKKLDFKSVFYAFLWLIGAAFSRIFNKNLYIGWNCISKFLKPIEKGYDTSIAFLERKTIYFNIDKVKAKNKIGFIHNDYNKYPFNYKLDKKYFKDYNKIATVSENCKNALINIFPEYKNKFVVIENMVSKELILKLSNEPIINYNIDSNVVNIVSVGRLTYQKGFDIAVEVCNKLINDGLKINWYVIGEGGERKNLEHLIKKYNLEKYFILVGADSNPYKWMKIADIYVQPSRFEGHSVTMMEIKAMEKLIIASSIPDFKNQLNNDKGILVDSIDEYCNKIKEVILNNEIKQKYIENLKKENNENQEEINKLYQMINNVGGE